MGNEQHVILVSKKPYYICVATVHVNWFYIILCRAFTLVLSITTKHIATQSTKQQITLFFTERMNVTTFAIYSS